MLPFRSVLEWPLISLVWTVISFGGSVLITCLGLPLITFGVLVRSRVARDTHWGALEEF